jgi:uncharacterized protein YhhL (DUF1145 family)
MTLRQYITIMTLATILCWSAWGFVIVNVDPFFANNLSLFFFYVSLFLAIMGTLSVVVFSFYSLFARERLPMFRYVQKSFRVAFITSSVIILLLFLQGSRLLNVWNFGVFIISVILISTLLLSMKKDKTNGTGIKFKPDNFRV